MAGISISFVGDMDFITEPSVAASYDTHYSSSS
jgi:hypothetical protein